MGVARKPKAVVTLSVTAPKLAGLKQAWLIAKDIHAVRHFKREDPIEKVRAVERRLASHWALRSAKSVQRLVDAPGLSRAERARLVAFAHIAHHGKVNTSAATKLLKKGVRTPKTPMTTMGFVDISPEVMARVDMNDYRADYVDELFADSSEEVKKLAGDKERASAWSEIYVAENLANIMEATRGAGETKLLLREGYDGVLKIANVSSAVDTAPRETNTKGMIGDNSTSVDVTCEYNGKRSTHNVKYCSALSSHGCIKFKAEDVFKKPFDYLDVFVGCPEGPRLFVWDASTDRPTSFLNKGFMIARKDIKEIPGALVEAGFIEIPGVSIDPLLLQRMEELGFNDLFQPPAPGMSVAAQGCLYEDLLLQALGGEPMLDANGRRDRRAEYDGTLELEGITHKLEAKVSNGGYNKASGLWSFYFNSVKPWLHDRLVVGMRVMHISDITSSSIVLLKFDIEMFEGGDIDPYSSFGVTTTGARSIKGFNIAVRAHANLTHCYESMWVSVVSIIRRLVRGEPEDTIWALAPRIGVTQAWSDAAFAREIKHLVARGTKSWNIPAEIKSPPQLAPTISGPPPTSAARGVLG
jgi:hypothetical protein